MRRLGAFSLGALACAVGAPALAEVELADESVYDVSLLQSVFRLQGNAADEATSVGDAGAASHESAPLRRSRIDVAVPSLVVDLDQAPERRWANVTEHWLRIGAYPQAVAKMFALRETLSPEKARLLRIMPMEDEYRREMQGIVAHLGLPDEAIDVFLYNSIAYEIEGPPDPSVATGCSGLLAAMTNGTVVHGRNMDYYGAKCVLGNQTLHYPELTVEVTFTRGGKPLYTSVQWPATTGLHTGMRFGGWSFEQNTRTHSYSDALQHGLTKGSEGHHLAVRKVMETTPDFETAVTRLQALNLMAPCYFIVAGAKAYEGAVITMDDGGGREKGTPLVARLGRSTTPVRRNGTVFEDWNIVQTNDDRNKAPIDQRRPVEEMRLAISTQDVVSPDWVFRNMEAPPLYWDFTVFTSIFVPATGLHQTFAHPENGH